MRASDSSRGTCTSDCTPQFVDLCGGQIDAGLCRAHSLQVPDKLQHRRKRRVQTLDIQPLPLCCERSLEHRLQRVETRELGGRGFATEPLGPHAGHRHHHSTALRVLGRALVCIRGKHNVLVKVLRQLGVRAAERHVLDRGAFVRRETAD